jgi:hypothetical protein
MCRRGFKCGEHYASFPSLRRPAKPSPPSGKPPSGLPPRPTRLTAHLRRTLGEGMAITTAKGEAMAAAVAAAARWVASGKAR